MTSFEGWSCGNSWYPFEHDFCRLTGAGAHSQAVPVSPLAAAGSGQWCGSGPRNQLLRKGTVRSDRVEEPQPT